VLLGVWDAEKECSGDVPSLGEIKRYFGFSRANKVYCAFAGRYGNVIVTPTRVKELRQHASYKWALHKHLHAHDGRPRMMVADSEEKVVTIESVVRQHRLVPVRMEPLP